ncbi:EmrB/QacA subfamily drug resistance transporter [Nonomuraea polychroma]|uniref:EmrB/QacA subfamily drug resistance transporter n=1 Tax=Nonomuraea polychroma TaxID=46176 RepID=A0A438MCE6_9ACTN|nr:MFS transporter [Nonomuraea polychroma]RVX43432.1 EmrB/QacA subfamily drug resistance transporter [Nonomuraea polychroma]
MRSAGTLAILLSAWFMAQFDFFVVNVAAPSIEHDLHTGPAALELIVGGYAFTYAAGMITGGRLGDRYGYRRVFIWGVAAFTVASVLCGIAVNPAQLVVARLLQGLAGAAMVPQVLATISAVYPPAERSRAVGWYGAVGGVGSIAGQVLGGLLLTADVLGLGWRVVFLINLPVGLFVVPLAAWLLPHVDTARRPKLDLPGAAGLAAGLALVLVPLGLGNSLGWPAWTWVSMAASVPVFALTWRWQRRLGARGGQPVLDLALLKVHSYLAGVGSIVAFMAYFAAFMFTLTLLLQGGMGLTAFQAGLAFAPMGVLFSLTSVLGTRLVRRYGLIVVMIGGTVTALGLGLLVATAGLGLPYVMGALMLVGAGNGLVLPQLIGAALVEVEPHQAGIGSGMLSTAQQFAGAGGVAVIGAVFFAAARDGGHVAAMRWSAAIDLGLVLIVIATVAYNRRRASRRERSRTAVTP